MKIFIISALYLALGAYSILIPSWRKERGHDEWNDAIKDRAWELDFASVTVSGGSSCKLKSSDYSIVVEGFRGFFDGSVWIKAKLYKMGGESEMFLAETQVAQNSVLEDFLKEVTQQEMDKAYHAQREELFRFEGTRRMVMFLEDRSLTYSDEQNKIQEMSKDYPRY